MVFDKDLITAPGKNPGGSIKSTYKTSTLQNPSCFPTVEKTAVEKALPIKDWLR